MEQFNYCLVAGQTDVGRKRAANEDNMGNAITQNGLVSVVCDGMGGHVGGATASRIAVNAILENLKNNYYEDPRIAIGESIDIANRAILNEAATRPELTGMGSTCVLLIVRNGKVYIGHVGDSRIYLIRSKRIIQLTKDHSYVQMLVDRGEITHEQAEHHPRKNEITNALGIPNMSPATVAEDAIIPEAGDCFLLCSDGLSGMVPDAVINKVVSRQSEMNAQARVDSLISIANENGGVDNITAQMVEFTITPGVINSGKRIPLWLKILMSALVLAVLGIGTYLVLNHRNKVDGNDGNEKDHGSYSVVDTIEVSIRDAVEFAAGKELVTIVFDRSSIAFKHGGKQVYSDTNIQSDPDSLKVNSPDIDIVIRGRNRVLKFTDNNPGKKVIVEISAVEPRKVHRFSFPVSQKQEVVQENTDLVSTAVIPVAVKHETVKIDLGEHALTSGDKLLFGYSVPYMKISSWSGDIDGVRKQLKDKAIDEVKNDEIELDGNLWSKELNVGHKLLSFTYLGRDNASKICKFVIPCVLKGSTDEIILEVTLTVAGIDGKEKKMSDETVKKTAADSSSHVHADSSVHTPVDSITKNPNDTLASPAK